MAEELKPRTTIFISPEKSSSVSSSINSTDTNVVVPEVKLLDRIGDGAFGCVYKAEGIRWSYSQQRYITDVFAVKKIPKGEGSSYTEIETQSCLGRHPNITFLYDWLENPPAEDVDNVWLITEYCEAGTLDALLQSTFIPLKTILNFSIDVSSACVFIHQNRVVHLDLKADNILLTAAPNGLVCKLSDFGIARVLSNDGRDTYKVSSLSKSCGPWYTSAPEVFTGAKMTDKSDIFSLGLLIMAMFTRTMVKTGPARRNLIVPYLNWPQRYGVPLHEASSEEILYMIATQCNEIFRPLLKQMLLKDYHVRPFSEVVLASLEAIESRIALKRLECVLEKNALKDNNIEKKFAKTVRERSSNHQVRELQHMWKAKSQSSDNASVLLDLHMKGSPSISRKTSRPTANPSNTKEKLVKSNHIVNKTITVDKDVNGKREEEKNEISKNNSSSKSKTGPVNDFSVKTQINRKTRPATLSRLSALSSTQYSVSENTHTHSMENFKPPMDNQNSLAQTNEDETCAEAHKERVNNCYQSPTVLRKRDQVSLVTFCGDHSRNFGRKEGTPTVKNKPKQFANMVHSPGRTLREKSKLFSKEFTYDLAAKDKENNAQFNAPTKPSKDLGDDLNARSAELASDMNNSEDAVIIPTLPKRRPLLKDNMSLAIATFKMKGKKVGSGDSTKLSINSNSENFLFSGSQQKEEKRSKTESCLRQSLDNAESSCKAKTITNISSVVNGASREKEINSSSNIKEENGHIKDGATVTNENVNQRSQLPNGQYKNAIYSKLYAKNSQEKQGEESEEHDRSISSKTKSSMRVTPNSAKEIATTENTLSDSGESERMSVNDLKLKFSGSTNTSWPSSEKKGMTESRKYFFVR